MADERYRKGDRQPGDGEGEWLANVESDDELQEKLREKEDLQRAFEDVNERLHRVVADNGKLRTELAEVSHRSAKAVHERELLSRELSYVRRDLATAYAKEPNLAVLFEEKDGLRKALAEVEVELANATEQNKILQETLSEARSKNLSYEHLRSRLLGSIESATARERSLLLQDLKTLDAIESEKQSRDREERQREVPIPQPTLSYAEARQQLLARIGVVPASDVKVLLKALKVLDDAETTKHVHAAAQADRRENLTQRRNRRWFRNAANALQNGFKLSAFCAGLYLVLTGKGIEGWILITGATGWTLTDAALKKLGL